MEKFRSPNRLLNRTFFFFLFFLGSFTPSFPEAAARPKARVGWPAPEFNLETTSGKKIALSDFRGKVLLLDFWATWCGPCRWSTPALVRLQEKFKNLEFSVIGISMDDSREPVYSYVKKAKVKHWTAFGGESSTPTDYNVRAIPTFFIVDSSGVIKREYAGFAPGMEVEWEREVLLLLAKNSKK